jgi:predicted ATPase
MSQLLKLNFENFGPIKRAEIEVRPLTVFIGPNNTGKTYVAYFVWGLQIGFMSQHSYSLLENSFSELIKQKEVELDLNELVKKGFLEKVLEERIDFLKNNFFLILNTDINKLSPFPVKAFVGNQIKDKLKEISCEKKINIEKLEDVEVWKKKGEEKLFLKVKKRVDGRIFKKGSKNRQNALNIIWEFLERLLFTNCLFKRAFVIPAERTALTVAYKDIYQVRAKATFTGKFEPEKFSKYPLPVSDFLDFMYSLLETPSTESFKEVVFYLEKKIINGQIELIQQKNIPFPSIFYTFPKGKIEIHTASSGVKALSALLLYLERAKPGELLIIDEPEINLHPQAQLRLMEALTMAVNKGLYVIITTHTPYLIDHLNNLMKGYLAHKRAKGKFDKVLKEDLKLPLESLISPEMVSAYSFHTDGTVRDILDRKEAFIDWETFGEVSTEVDVISSKLDKLLDNLGENEAEEIQR